MDIEATIKRILVERLDIDAAVVNASDSNAPLLGHGIGLDSVEALQLVVGLEQAFDLEVPDEDLNIELFESISSLVRYVEKRLAAAPQQE
jgi:acyl carrier protein